jgi:SPP1 gp7 family putative phage head morphogenesis protein
VPEHLEAEEMKDETWRKIEEAQRAYHDELIAELTVQMYEAYFWGDYGTWAESNLKIDRSNFEKISADSKAYAEQWGKMLSEQGGSMINGEFKPWLWEYEEEDRAKITKIINDGLAEGHQTGIKERVKGGYPEGTIAKDLEPYFGEHKSHATMVARTEVARIQNIGAITRMKKNGFTHVKVHDGSVEGGSVEGCDRCREVDGQIWTIEEAEANELEHPNCVRAFSPVMPE